MLEVGKVYAWEPVHSRREHLRERVRSFGRPEYFNRGATDMISVLEELEVVRDNFLLLVNHLSRLFPLINVFQSVHALQVDCALVDAPCSSSVR